MSLSRQSRTSENPEREKRRTKKKSRDDRRVTPKDLKEYEPETISRKQKNLRILNRLIERISRPGVYARIQLDIKDGILGEHIGTTATIRISDKDEHEIEKILEIVVDT